MVIKIEKKVTRKKENIDLIHEDIKFKFINQEQIWRDLDNKSFYLLGFISVIVGFIISTDLLNIFDEDIWFILKLFFLIGIILIFIAGFKLIKIILPLEFKTGAKTEDLVRNYQKNNLVSIKKEIMGIYRLMNRDNKKTLLNKANTFKIALNLLIIGLLLIVISKSQSLIDFIYMQIINILNFLGGI